MALSARESKVVTILLCLSALLAFNLLITGFWLGQHVCYGYASFVVYVFGFGFGPCVWVWIWVYYSFGFGVVYGHRLRWLTELSKGIYVHPPRDPCRSEIPLDSYSYFLRSLVEICLTKPEFCESDRTCQAADLHVIKSSCCESSPGSLDCRAVFLHSMHSDLMKVTTVCVMSMVSLIILNVVIYWVFGTSTEDNFIRRYVRALEGWHVFQHYILERVPPAA